MSVLKHGCFTRVFFKKKGFVDTILSQRYDNEKKCQRLKGKSEGERIKKVIGGITPKKCPRDPRSPTRVEEEEEEEEQGQEKEEERRKKGRRSV